MADTATTATTAATATTVSGAGGGAGAAASSTVSSGATRVVGTAQNHWVVDDNVVDVSRTKPLVVPHPITITTSVDKKLRLDVTKAALVVVDMQNLFAGSDGLKARRGGDVSGAAALVPTIAALLKPWRAAGGKVVWVSWGVRVDNANLPPGVRYPFTSYIPGGLGTPVQGPGDMKGNRMLAKGSYEAKLVTGLEPVGTDTPEGDIAVHKHRISGFYDTPLETALRVAGRHTLLFAGVNADQCVLHTLADASFLGFDCVMLEDCVATSSPAFCLQATLHNVGQCFGFVSTAAAVQEGLKAAPAPAATEAAAAAAADV